tara:strand:- start:801 stop:1181 length:381 start_codon:yes stop_codon:yes gene_type:complete
MKLKTTGIDHVNLQVLNLEESCRFWNKLLGFKELEDIPDQNGKIIGTKEAKLALYENVEMEIKEKGGFSHVSFHIENFEDIEEVCVELGLKIKYSGTVQWPKSRSIYINDPNGYEIELSEVWGGGI